MGKRKNFKAASQASLLAVCKQVIDEHEGKPMEGSRIGSVIAAASSDSAEVQLQGLLALVIISEDDSNKILAAKMNAGAVAAAACESDNDKIMYAASRVLWQLSKIEEARPYIMNGGGIDAAGKVLATDSPANQYAGLRVLMHLCEGERYRDPVLKSDTIPYNMTKLLASDTDQVAYVAASALAHLADSDPEHPALVDDEFVGTLCLLCTDGSDNNKYAAFGLVRALTRNDVVLNKMTAAGCFEALTEAVGSTSERLQYIGIMTYTALPEQAEQRMGRLVKPVIHAMRSERPSVVMAAAKFIEKYFDHEDLMDGLQSSSEFEHFVQVLSKGDPNLGHAVSKLLNVVLMIPECAAAFVEQGGVDSMQKMLKSGSENAMAGAVALLWPVCCYTEAEQMSEIEKKVGKMVVEMSINHSGNNERFLCFLCLSLLYPEEPSSETEEANSLGVESFEYMRKWISSNDYKKKCISYSFSRGDIEGMFTKFRYTHSAGMMLYTWAVAFVSKHDSKAFLMGDGYGALDLFATQGTAESCKLANMILKSMDLMDSTPPDEATALLEFFIEDIKKEIKRVEEVTKKRDELEKDLKFRYKKHENVDKIPTLMKGCDYVSTEANNLLKKVPAVRQKIDDLSVPLVKELEEMDPLVPKLQRELEVFQELFNKEEDKEAIREIKVKIADLAKFISEVGKKITAQESIKAGYEVEKRELVARQQRRPALESQRIQLVVELEDVNYQIDNYDSAIAEMESAVGDIEPIISELQTRLDELIVLQEGLHEEVETVEAEVTKFETSKTKYDKLVDTIKKFKYLRGELKAKYGEELSDLVELHQFLGSLMTAGYNQLKALSGEETPRDRDSAFTKDNLNKFLDYGSKAEVELDERVSNLWSQLEGGLFDARKRRKDKKEEAAAMDERVNIARLNISREVDKVTVADMRRGQMPSKDQLEIIKRKIVDKISKIDDEFKEIDQLQGPIDKLTDKIEEEMKTLAHDEAHKRKLDADLMEYKRQIKMIESNLDQDLDKFAKAFGSFKRLRAELQHLMRPLLQKVTEWKKTFDEERAVMEEAWNSFHMISVEISAQIDRIRLAKEDVLFDEGAEFTNRVDTIGGGERAGY